MMYVSHLHTAHGVCCVCVLPLTYFPHCSEKNTAILSHPSVTVYPSFIHSTALHLDSSSFSFPPSASSSLLLTTFNHICAHRKGPSFHSLVSSPPSLVSFSFNPPYLSLLRSIFLSTAILRLWLSVPSCVC